MHHNYITKSRQVNDILFQIRSCSVEDRTTYETRVVVVIHRALAVCKKYSKRSVDGANKLIVWVPNQAAEQKVRRTRQSTGR